MAKEAKLTDSLKATLKALADYLEDPARARISRNNMTYSWWKAATAAGVSPANFHLRSNWVRTTRALCKRGLVEWAPYDWELRGEVRKDWGLRLTEAGRAELDS